MFGDKCMVVKYVQLYPLFPPFTFLREGKWHEIVSKIIARVRIEREVVQRRHVFFQKSKQKEREEKDVTYFFMPFSKVSRTRVEASLTYVLVDVPLIPEASLKLDRLDCSGTDR